MGMGKATLHLGRLFHSIDFLTWVSYIDLKSCQVPRHTCFQQRKILHNIAYPVHAGVLLLTLTWMILESLRGQLTSLAGAQRGRRSNAPAQV